MRSWYEFGFNGFPTGEERRRFYRQRDDPCDSEEEHFEDDETNDRPIYYYPMRNSEGDSASAASQSPTGDEDFWEDDELATAAEAQRRCCLGPHGVPLLSCYLDATVYEGVPAWCGASAVCYETADHARFVVSHGGAPVATRVADNSFRVMRLARSSRHDAVLRGTVGCTPVPEDAALQHVVRWDLLHPVLAQGRPHERPRCAPTRFAHCAVPLHLSSPEACGWLVRQQEVAARRRPHAMAHPVGAFFTEGSAPHEVHLSLVVGGSATAPADDHVKGLNFHRPRARCHPLACPALCLTVLRPQAAAAAAHWTTYHPLSDMTVAPRTYATLTRWPELESAGREPEALRWAYLGGTENGWDPLPLMELSLLRLHLPTWTLLETTVATYGTAPPPRFGHTTTAAESHLLLFGGVGQQLQYLCDLYLLDCATLVWREVFVSVRPPRRAFHAAALVRCRGAGDVADGARHLVASPRPPRAEPDPTLGEEEEEKALSATSLLRRRTKCALVLLGGEAEGVAVPSAWQYALDSGEWCELHFPLLRSSGSFHLCPMDVAEGGGQLRSATALHHVVLSLMEKEGDGAGDNTTHYLAACHGALPQLLPCPGPPTATSGDELLLLGGSKSPPVLLASHVQPTEGTLREAAAFWCFRSEPSRLGAVESLRQAAPQLFQRLFFRLNLQRGTDSGALSWLPQQQQQQQQQQETAVGPEDALQHLVRQSVLENQLACWLRYARRRLRSQ